MASSPDNYLLRRIEVGLEVGGLIGKQAWSLLSSYGRIVNGTYSGSYVSGVPFAEQLNIARRLVRGETVPVHLMHRHRSGDSGLSWLRWSQTGGLVMVFSDREKKA